MKTQRDDYKMIQIGADIHKLLKEYCAKNGFKMGHLVNILIRKHIKGK